MRFALAVLAPAAALLGADLPPPAPRAVDFAKEVQPLFEAACVKCHAKGKSKGGFSIESRDAFLHGGDSGTAAEIGKSNTSLLIKLVASTDPDEQMPKKELNGLLSKSESSVHGSTKVQTGRMA